MSAVRPRGSRWQVVTSIMEHGKRRTVCATFATEAEARAAARSIDAERVAQRLATARQRHQAAGVALSSISATAYPVAPLCGATGAITLAVSATAALADDRGEMDGLAIFAGVVAVEAFLLVVVGVVTVFAPVKGEWAITPAEIVRWIDPPSDPTGPAPFDAGTVDRNMALLLGVRADENAERLELRYAWFTVAIIALATEVLALALTVWRYTT